MSPRVCGGTELESSWGAFAFLPAGRTPLAVPDLRGIVGGECGERREGGGIPRINGRGLDLVCIAGSRDRIPFIACEAFPGSLLTAITVDDAGGLGGRGDALLRDRPRRPGVKGRIDGACRSDAFLTATHAPGSIGRRLLGIRGRGFLRGRMALAPGSELGRLLCGSGGGSASWVARLCYVDEA